LNTSAAQGSLESAYDIEMASFNLGILWTVSLFGNVMFSTALGWGSNEKIKLTDVNVLTLHQGKMTNSRRTHPVPQLQCVGGSGGCSAFTPRVVQCYNTGFDGYDVQWECKTDMDGRYRFGEIAVNCEGYSYPDDPYILKGSCGLEYSIDVVEGGHYHSYHDSGYRDGGYQSHHHNSYKRRSGDWLGSFIMWGIIAFIAYYIYQHWSSNTIPHTPGGYTQSSTPPPAGFRPEYVPDEHSSAYRTSAGSGLGGDGFWAGAATGGFLGYLFGNSGRQTPYYNDFGYYGSGYHRPRTGWGLGGSNWFGLNNSWSSNTGWSSGSSYRRFPSPPSTRTSSGFGGTKRR